MGFFPYNWVFYILYMALRALILYFAYTIYNIFVSFCWNSCKIIILIQEDDGSLQSSVSEQQQYPKTKTRKIATETYDRSNR